MSGGPPAHEKGPAAPVPRGPFQAFARPVAQLKVKVAVWGTVAL
jgi:hypothetical protein